MSQHNDDGWMEIVAVVVVLAAAGLLWKFSNVIGVDMLTGAKVAGLHVLFVGIAIAVWHFTEISWRETWYVLLAFLWLAWIPAFDFHADAHRTAAAFDETLSFWTVWYGNSLVQLVMFFAILGGGFFVQKKIEES